jgi:hypothetical protein
MQGTTKHELGDFTGKTIKSIFLYEVEEDEGPQQYFLITFVGGVQKVLACSSPLSVIELEDLEEILENSIPSELDEVDEDVTEYDEDEDEEDFDDRSELNFDDD